MSSEVVYVTSGFCQTGTCVEAARLPDGSIAMRDSKDRNKPPYIFAPVEWAEFIAGVKLGEFDFSD